MSDLLEKAAVWLEDQRSRHASRVVSYVRGGRTLDLPATVGKTVFEVDDGYGVLVRHESRDFLVLAADLVLDGAVILPQRGDRVHEVQGSTTFIYEVTAPGKEPAWRYSDPYRTSLRIHTKQVEGN